MAIIKQSILGVSYSMKISIKLLAATLILSFFSGNIFAHGGEDPYRKLAKHLDQISEYQKDFNSEADTIKRKKNLESQLSSLRSRLLVLRNELVGDTSTVKCLKKQSEIDYFKELERTLKSSQPLLSFALSNVSSDGMHGHDHSSHDHSASHHAMDSKAEHGHHSATKTMSTHNCGPCLNGDMSHCQCHGVTQIGNFLVFRSYSQLEFFSLYDSVLAAHRQSIYRPPIFA